MEYGQRQAFEAALSQSGIGQQTGPQGPMPGAAPTGGGIGAPSNPLDPLLSGELAGSNAPLTEGLSVGPGAGPVGDVGIADSTVQRLRMVASQARSPVLRQLARDALRTTIRERRGQG